MRTRKTATATACRHVAWSVARVGKGEVDEATATALTVCIRRRRRRRAWRTDEVGDDERARCHRRRRRGKVSSPPRVEGRCLRTGIPAGIVEGG